MDLASLIEACSDGRWIFRGVSSEGHPLRPRAGRVGAARKRPYAVEDEREALELFKKQARPYLSHTPATDLEWLAIAEHHGLSTRLLDWTESPLVGAFFAVQRAGTKGDGVIFGVQGMRSVTKAEEQDPFSLAEPAVYRPPHLTPRIPSQRSVFTVHPDPRQRFSHPTLVEWRISQAACARIKLVLDACAVNESSLFPDIDGLSRYIAWRYKWAKF